jgi:hypothetical protein
MPCEWLDGNRETLLIYFKLRLISVYRTTKRYNAAPKHGGTITRLVGQSHGSFVHKLWNTGMLGGLADAYAPVTFLKVLLGCVLEPPRR